MSNDFTQKEIDEIGTNIKNMEPVPLGVQMREEAFKFLMDKMRIVNREKYKIDYGIKIVNPSHSTLGKYDCRIIYSDNTSTIHSVRERV